MTTDDRQTYLIVGATRGIGREFVRQVRQGCNLIATARGEDGARLLKASIRMEEGVNAVGDTHGSETVWNVLECDVEKEESIASFGRELYVLCGREGVLGEENGTLRVGKIDYVVVCAGVLGLGNVVGTEGGSVTYTDFERHMRTNTVGPLMVAQKILKIVPDVRNIVFMSSDSGSAGRFRPEEDGFAAYAASKSALNQGLRADVEINVNLEKHADTFQHMAAELSRNPHNASKSAEKRTVVMAMHPGEVNTDMAKINVSWDIGPQMTPEESVLACLNVMREKSEQTRREGKWEARFWTWKGDEYPW